MPAGAAIMENADFMFLLGQRPESIEALKQSQRVSLSEGYYDLLKTVHTDTGNYSEIFLYTPMGISIGRIVLDRFEQLLYTNKADEFQLIQQYKNEGLTISKAINKVIEGEAKKSFNN